MGLWNESHIIIITQDNHWIHVIIDLLNLANIYMKLNSPLPEWDFSSIFNLGLQYDWLKTCDEGFMELWYSTKGDINQKKLVLYLIHNFLYVDSNRADVFCERIVRQITEVWGLQPRNTTITATCDNSNPDGSQLMVQKLKNRFPFHWHEFDFSNSLPEALYKKIHSNDNLVICDDFVGTGLTIGRKTEYALKVIRERELENVQIYIVSFAAMQFSKKAILYPFYSCEWLPKGISETLTGDNLVIATRIMEEMERILNPKIGRQYLPKFGFERSESLYNYENDNIPNNVFPIFWWKKYKDNRFRVPMFRKI